MRSGGVLYISKGGTLAGVLNVISGGIASAYTGATVNFDLRNRSTADSALINDLSLLSGNPAYTITVSPTQSFGTYKLAAGAGNFNGSITIGDCTNTYGEVSLDAILFNNVFYSLRNTDGNLNLTISSSMPAPDPEPEPAPVLSQKFFAGNKWTELPLEDGWNVVGVEDFNGDGKSDILRQHDSGLVIGDLSDGWGNFAPQVLNMVGSGWAIKGSGDFDGDGVGDVLVANPQASATIGLLGYWKSGTAWTLIDGYSPEWSMISTGDFNNDGQTDMLWRNEFTGLDGSTYNAYCTWLVGETVNWRIVSSTRPEDWDFLCSGDFNADGANDIAMINSNGAVGIWEIQDGYLAGWNVLSIVDQTLFDLAGVGDFNGDGTDDIAWCNTETGLTGYWQIKDKTLESWQNIATIA